MQVKGNVLGANCCVFSEDFCKWCIFSTISANLRPEHVFLKYGFELKLITLYGFIIFFPSAHSFYSVPTAGTEREKDCNKSTRDDPVLHKSATTTSGNKFNLKLMAHFITGRG